LPVLRRWGIPLFYLPAAILTIMMITGNGFIESLTPLAIGYRYTTPPEVGPPLTGWAVNYRMDSVWYWLYILELASSAVGSSYLIVRWYMRSPRKREKRQARIILITLIPALVLSIITGFIIPLFDIVDLPPLVPLIMTVWIWGMGYAIRRYRLLTLTPAEAAEKILSKISDMVLLLAPDGRIISSNQRFHEVSGYTERFLRGIPCRSILSGPLPSIEPDESAAFEISVVTRTGTEIPTVAAYSGITDSEGDFLGWVLSMQDARLMKRLEKENRERLAAEEKFTKAFIHSPIAIILTDASTGTILDVNEAAVKLSGYTRSEMIGRTTLELGIWKNRNQRTAVLQKLQSTGPGRGVEAELISRSGVAGTYYISKEEIEIEGKHRALFSLLDMTELKHLEAENLKVKKLESIASLSGGIAHDFNNILTAVMGNLSLAKFSCHEDDELFTHLENAYAACLRAKDLTWKLLIFSRGGMPEKKEVNLRKVIEEAGSISLAGSQAAIVTDLRDDPIVVLGDRDLFTQVFHNLFMNAVHAMPDGGTITIREEMVPGPLIANGRYDQSERNGPSPQNWYRFQVIDTGTGIPKGVIGRIFDPYYTTKPNGTGLGLSIVNSIVTNHGGSITVESEEGKGTCFTLLFPASSPPMENS